MDEREGVPPQGGAPSPYSGAGPDPIRPDPAVPPRDPAIVPPVPPRDPAIVPPDGLADSRPQANGTDGVAPGFDESFDTGRLQQLPTGQLLLVHRPGMPDRTPVLDDDVEVDVQRRVYSWVGAVVGSVGALASLFVGWMLPLAIAAIVFGVLGLRREEHGRTLAFVGIGTGITGLVFSAVWLGYYAIVYGALPA